MSRLFLSEQKLNKILGELGRARVPMLLYKYRSLSGNGGLRNKKAEMGELPQNQIIKKKCLPT
jgi:hypothetical protein